MGEAKRKREEAAKASGAKTGDGFKYFELVNTADAVRLPLAIIPTPDGRFHVSGALLNGHEGDDIFYDTFEEALKQIPTTDHVRYRYVRPRDVASLDRYTVIVGRLNLEIRPTYSVAWAVAEAKRRAPIDGFSLDEAILVMHVAGKSYVAGPIAHHLSVGA